ncbi:unnamed protein product [Didymodactylos carnosus]|uniref:Sulfotransferase domain-containing protein n=1 Tax=Didymodactylos carnosus TaxID=1234261 RepID=A0A814JR96_9BILA|nr:unnamed protein product [Didymodactylos carnosus]CAF1042659.1 unnamed protein product [Didymodactylos carnosus]CAF3744768.1 unnamed protein product [Didymodactylos carnosus]CAF3812810.1 unnamed protein product [Didymodactylos carnosus]
MEKHQTAASNENEEKEPFPLIDGIRWVPEWGLESLYFALSYQARADDLFIVTYPRSGTTWMQNIVYNLQTGGQPFDADRDHFFEQNPTLELDGELGIEIMQRPGAIKTHLPMDRVSNHPLAKYICVIRNPKDVCVSYYVFYNMLGEVPKLEFDQFFQYFIDGRLLLNDYFEVLRSTWQRRNEDNVLLVSYEDMRTDLRSVICKVANFINIVLSDELLEQVMQHSSFDYMKDKFDAERRMFEAKIIENTEDKIAAAQRREKFIAESEMKIVRKGEINDWKSFMTPEQSRRIYDRFMATCKNCEGLENYWSKWNIF